jgi:hypothetical protein
MKRKNTPIGKLTDKQMQDLKMVRQEWRKMGNVTIFTHNRKTFYFQKLWATGEDYAKKAARIAKKYGFTAVIKKWQSSRYGSGNLFDCIVRVQFTQQRTSFAPWPSS